MNIGKKTDLQEENVIQAIHNISEQLTYIKSFYKENKTISNDVHSEKENEIQQIQTSIESLVDDIEEEQNDTDYSAFQVVSVEKDNDTLVISEKMDKVFLPYKVSELEEYLKEYPDDYKSLSDVVNQEYIIPFHYFRNQTTSRFKEVYCLMRDIEMKSIIESFKKAVQMMFNSKLNPAVISACKSEEQLNKYVSCVQHNNLEEFKEFEIIFDVNPLKSNNLENQFLKAYPKGNSFSAKSKRRKARGRHHY